MAEPDRRSAAVPNDLEAFWVPFTPNRAFKRAPRLISRAKDMHYYTPENRAGSTAPRAVAHECLRHNRAPIVEAIKRQAEELITRQCSSSRTRLFRAGRAVSRRRPAADLDPRSSATPARKQSRPRSRSCSPTTTSVARSS